MSWGWFYGWVSEIFLGRLTWRASQRGFLFWTEKVLQEGKPYRVLDRGEIFLGSCRLVFWGSKLEGSGRESFRETLEEKFWEITREWKRGRAVCLESRGGWLHCFISFVGFGGRFRAFKAEHDLIGEGHSQVWMQQIYCLIWILITPLCFLLIFECCLVCLGWIMKATCCLLRYNLELMFDIVNLSISCLYCEIPKNHANICIWCCFSHLIRGLTDDPWSEASFMLGFFLMWKAQIKSPKFKAT